MSDILDPQRAPGVEAGNRRTRARYKRSLRGRSRHCCERASMRAAYNAQRGRGHRAFELAVSEHRSRRRDPARATSQNARRRIFPPRANDAPAGFRMILLDTNVVSEFVKPAANMMRQDGWTCARHRRSFSSARRWSRNCVYGVASFADGKKQDLRCSLACERVENETFAGRDAAVRRARGASVRRALRAKRSLGQGIAVMDAMIAAIALAHAMTLATRNVRDFEGLGVPLVDPFSQ